MYVFKLICSAGMRLKDINAVLRLRRNWYLMILTITFYHLTDYVVNFLLTFSCFLNMYYARYCLICSLSNYCDPLKLNCKEACQRINPSQVYYLPSCFQNKFLSYTCTCTLCFDVFFLFYWQFWFKKFPSLKNSICVTFILKWYW